jgi:hypothetical protein
LAINRDLLEKLSIIKNFNNQTVIWDADTTPMKYRDTTLYCKTIHACAYTVPRSVEQQLLNEIIRLVGIGVLEEDYFSECILHGKHFPFLRKMKQ